MTASLLLCWYALGWVNCGLFFAVKHEPFLDVAFFCFLLSPVVIGIFVCEFVAKLLIAKLPGAFIAAKQYLWRRP